MKVKLTKPFTLAGGRNIPAGYILDVTPQKAQELVREGSADLLPDVVNTTLGGNIPWRYDVEQREAIAEPEPDELEEQVDEEQNAFLQMLETETDEEYYNRDNYPRRRKRK